MMTKKLRRFIAIGIILGSLAAAVWAAARHASRGGVLMTISKETTVVTDPLRKDGYVDYVAAANKILSKDVTPENNAIVPLWDAMGPAAVPQANRAEYFRLLGTKSPVDFGNYFITVEDFVRKQAVELDVLDEQLSKAQQRPWTKNEFPVLAAWLAANQAPLETIVAASRRPRFYSPLVGDDTGMLMNVVLPAPRELRHATQALLARANLRLAQGETEVCWQDLLAAHRLARLCGQGFCLVEALIAQLIDGTACNGDQTICQTVGLSAPDALRMRDELSRLTPLPNIADVVGRGERWSVLSDIVSIARGDGTGSKGLLETVGRNITDDALDWDIPLRIMNSWIDRDIVALRKPTAKAQQEALDQIHEQLRLIADSRTSGAPSLISFHNDFSEFVGQQIAALMLPAVDKANDSAHIAEMRFELTKLSFSLAAYRADHGSFPTRLNELVPKYADKIPEDAFSGGDLHYKPGGDGYELYSVGRNGIDDGGRDTVDKDGEDCDDIFVRVRHAP
jgi:hypothetical protein